MIEKEITNVLLSKGSFFKFVYQDNQDNWFSINEENEEFKFHHMNKGIW